MGDVQLWFSASLCLCTAVQSIFKRDMSLQSHMRHARQHCTCLLVLLTASTALSWPCCGSEGPDAAQVGYQRIQCQQCCDCHQTVDHHSIVYIVTSCAPLYIITRSFCCLSCALPEMRAIPNQHYARTRNLAGKLLSKPHNFSASWHTLAKGHARPLQACDGAAGDSL